MYTTTFIKTAEAYAKGYGFIENRGGTRSGKTYGELQLLDLIAQKPKKRVITTVGLSIPHLKGGAIRDYDNILNERGIIPDLIRTKDPYIYNYGQTIHEFISFDNLGKALGSARDILFLNECNKMPWDIVHQLIQRTTECVFADYNPSTRFWIDDSEGYDINSRKDAVSIHSTFQDNYENLSSTQKEEFRIGERKAKEEEARGVYGYWSNWWKVYGLGEYGQIEGAIYTDWSEGEFNTLLPYRFGLDFGFSSDPDALVKVAVDEKNKAIYLHECMYKNGQSFDTLKTNILNHCKRNDLIVADSAEDRLIFDLSRSFNIVRCSKWKVIERIKKMQSYHLVVTPSSTNLINELMQYVWSDKKSETPIDKSNHLLDAVGYALTGMPMQQTSKISLP